MPYAMGENMFIFPEEIFCFSREKLFQPFSGFPFRFSKGHGKFPHGSQHAPGRPFVEKYLSLPDPDAAGRLFFFWRLFRRAEGQFLFFSMSKGCAVFRQRAEAAAGILRYADIRAQIH